MADGQSGANLVSIEEAQAAGPRPRRRRCPPRASPIDAAADACWRSRPRRRRPAAVRQLGDGRLRAPRRRHARDACPCRSGSPPDALRRAPLDAGRGDGDRDRRRRAGRAPTPSSRSSMLSRHDNSIEFAEPSPQRARTSARAAATCGGARSSSARGRGSGRRSSARSRRRASPRCASRGGRAPRCSRPAASSAGRASRSSRDRSTRRTGCCSPRSSRRQAPRSSGCARSPTTRPRTARRSRAGSRRTCSSPPAASRSARTTSSGRIEAELGVEEVFWGVAVKPGKPISFGVRGGHARLRAAGEPGLGRSSASSCSSVRRCSRSRAPPSRCRASSAGGSRGARRRERARGTSSSGPGCASTTTDRVLDPLPGQESHMIARAARGRRARARADAASGELAAGRSGRLPALSSSRPTACRARSPGGAVVGAVTRTVANEASRRPERAAARRRSGTARSGRRRSRRAVAATAHQARARAATGSGT